MNLSYFSRDLLVTVDNHCKFNLRISLLWHRLRFIGFCKWVGILFIHLQLLVCSFQSLFDILNHVCLCPNLFLHHSFYWIYSHFSIVDRFLNDAGNLKRVHFLILRVRSSCLQYIFVYDICIKWLQHREVYMTNLIHTYSRA